MSKTRGTLAKHSLGTSYGVPYAAYSRLDETLWMSQPHWRLRNGRWSGGGPFFVTRDVLHNQTGASYFVRAPDGSVRQDMTFGHVDGVVLASAAPPSRPTQQTYAQAQAEAYPYSAGLWKRARPGNPTASAFSGAGEIFKEGLPHLPLKLLGRLRSIRAIGSEYLNVQFGWAPLVSDIRKMHRTYETLNRQLAQLRALNGQSFRRVRHLEPTNTVEVLEDSRGTGYYRCAPTAFALGDPVTYHSTKRRETVVKTWLVARWRFYVPDIGSDQWTRRATRALYGANPTPEALWNLLPWSWLIDWFSNVGDVMSNISENAVDNLVAEYAYLMRSVSIRTTSEVRITGSPEYAPKGGYYRRAHGSFSVSTSRLQETKLRMLASPYGFGVTFDGLSPYQASILGALGISRRSFG